MSERRQWGDAEVLAHFTMEKPLTRYCVICGEAYVWGRLKLDTGEFWLPLWLMIDDNELALAAPGALCRAGARTFRSAEEAVAWGRENGDILAVSDAPPRLGASAREGGGE